MSYRKNDEVSAAEAQRRVNDIILRVYSYAGYNNHLSIYLY